MEIVMRKIKSDPIRVVVVDDTSTVCELLVAILEQAGDIQVVGIGFDGEDAVRLTKRLRPDVVTLDVRMPRVDGLEATRRIMREVPTPIVIVTGSLMRAGEDLTFEALQAGALTVIKTPGLADVETCNKVVETVRLMSDVPVVHHWGREALKPMPAVPVAQSALDIDDGRSPQMIGIAASTGGPRVLVTVLKPLPTDFPVPILVVQHITGGFATGMAEWLDTETALHVGLASHGDAPQPGTVLLAPDDYHLQVNAKGTVELSREPPYRGLRPSANYLFRSLARAYGPRAVGVVLTGMGDDGAEGLETLRLAGGLTVAQDEQSCVVYGMPYEAVVRNAVDRVLTPDQIATTFGQLAERVSSKRGGQ